MKIILPLLFLLLLNNITFAQCTGDILRGDALDFDGSNDHVRTGITSINTSFTLESWVTLNTLNPSAPFPGILGKWKSATLERDVVLDFSNGTNLFRAVINNEGVAATTISSTTVPVVGAWYHIAMTYDGVTLRLYINGVEEAAQAVSNGIQINTSELYIGNNENNTDYWNGKIDEVRIWNLARTADEIRGNMHLTLDGCETDLLAYYQMNDGTGSSILTDKTGNGNDGTLTTMDPATDWVASSVNVGNDAATNSNSQSIATVPAGVSTQNFAAANLNMRFFAHSGVQDYTVTYQEFTPNGTVGVNGVNIIQNPIWTVNKSTATATQLVDYTFTFPAATFINLDPTKYGLYWRAMNADGDWTKIATAHSVTATSVGFGKISLTGQFMIVQESNELISDVRGNMYDLDGSNDYIEPTTALGLGTSDFTFETWFKSDNASTTMLFGQDVSGGNSHKIRLDHLSNSLRFVFGTNFTGTGITSPAGSISTGAWYHVAVTRSGDDYAMYINGVLSGTVTYTGLDLDQNPFPFRIGARGSAGPQNLFNGSMDEFRIWNVVRTPSEIREKMHLTLKGNEIGLQAYYQFNNDDAVGTVGGVKDATGTNNATTQNMAATAYKASEVAVAGGTSDRLTIGVSGVYTFPNTGVRIDFGTTTPNGEIVISRLETEKPHGYETLSGDVDNEYFVVNNYGANSSFSPLNDITFNRMNYIASSDVGMAQAASPFQLYKRVDRAFGGTWGTTFGGADNAVAGTNGAVGYNATNNLTSFSQLVVVNTALNSDLPVELLGFEAVRINADAVQLDWSTASELNNKGFYIERMLALEEVFEAIAFVDGNGTTVVTNYYAKIDENSYSGVSYYRLKQIDFDGTVSYSDTKAVEGRRTVSNTDLEVAVYPNPSQDELHIRFGELPSTVKRSTIQVLSLNGQVLHQLSVDVASFQVLTLHHVEQLSAGVYCIRIALDNGEELIQKFVKQ